MAKLTDGKAGTIAKAEPPETGQRFIFDDHRDAPRGFGLRITSAGGKAFVLRYATDGRQRLKTIGDWPAWSLEAARIEAGKLVQQVQSGGDPLADKAKRRAEMTMSELADLWLTKKIGGLKTESAVRGYVTNDINPHIGKMKITDVRRADVIDVVEAKAVVRPAGAAKVLAHMRAMLDFAVDRDLIPANPAAGLKPSSIAAPGKRNPLKAVARGRVLDDDEIRSFWQAAETSGMRHATALCLKLVLCTGQRPGEVAGMHESEIRGDVWTIPATRRGKTETPASVHLTATAKELITRAQCIRDGVSHVDTTADPRPVFEITHGKTTRPIRNVALSAAVERLAEKLGAKDIAPWGRWTPHDLRRTMRTGLSACKVRPDIAELCIGHSKRGMAAVYDQHDYAVEMRAAMRAWEARLLQIIDGKDPDHIEQGDDNVVQLEVRR